MIAVHGYRQTAEGPGGGDIAKLSVYRPPVRDYVERLGGGLQSDYILQPDQNPLFIDANPRLVEPMNAVFSGVNLAGILVRISTGEPVAPVEPVHEEVRTHMLLMALLSKTAVRKRRLDVIGELRRAIRGRGPYRGSREELLPLRIDFKSLFSLAYVVTRLLLNPESADAMSAGSIASYSQTAAARLGRSRTAAGNLSAPLAHSLA